MLRQECTRFISRREMTTTAAVRKSLRYFWRFRYIPDPCPAVIGAVHYFSVITVSFNSHATPHRVQLWETRGGRALTHPRVLTSACTYPSDHEDHVDIWTDQ